MHVWFFAFLFIIFSSMWGFFSLFALYTWLYYTQYHQSLISAVQHYIIMSDIATFLGCVCLCIVLPQSDIHSTRSVGYRKNFLLLLIFFLIYTYVNHIAFVSSEGLYSLDLHEQSPHIK